MKFVPDYKSSSFNPEWLEKNDITPTAKRIDFHTEYAELWNKVNFTLRIAATQLLQPHNRGKLIYLNRRRKKAEDDVRFSLLFIVFKMQQFRLTEYFDEPTYKLLSECAQSIFSGSKCDLRHISALGRCQMCVQMFCTNDVSVAEKICDPNIKVHNLLLSQETEGLADFKKDLAGIFEGKLSQLAMLPYGGSGHKFLRVAEGCKLESLLICTALLLHHTLKLLSGM